LKIERPLGGSFFFSIKTVPIVGIIFERRIDRAGCFSKFNKTCAEPIKVFAKIIVYSARP
jgi:hypothetical protein